ncbi:MAG TPA: HEAT repeat domain-containing protein [Gemmatimonadaceae bacterium]|nr:HEAT repeat domain-containing protein [Gemmatimonadaceae bacterium]
MSSTEATFPARFAELVYLLAHQPDAVAEQQSVLAEAVAALSAGGASLTTGQLNVDLLDEGQSTDAVRLHELVMRMSAHSAHQIDVMSAAPPYEVLGVAQILAGEAHPDDDGAAFDEKLVKLGPTFVEVHLGRSGFVRTGGLTPTSAPRIESVRHRTPTPFRAMPAYTGSTPGSNAAVRPTPTRTPSLTPVGGALTLGASLTTDLPPAPRPTPGVPTIRDESIRIIEGAIQSKSLASMSDEALIEQLRKGVTPQKLMKLLDELVGVAEASALEGRWEVVARVFDAFVRNEAMAEHHAELRRAYTIAIRRLTKASLLRGIAGLLPRRRELRDGLQDVLIRLGPDGAEALIDLLTTADSLTDRRAYLAALAKCRDAVPTLMHLLGDNRWYVARNATDLLGEMRAPEAENALLEVVGHREERVRRSVATALSRLGTPRAIQAVQQMFTDPVPEVRLHAVQGIGSTKSPRAVGLLARALDAETDPEVQAVILAALGKQATPEAVARLVKTAEAEGRLFRRKPTSLRVCAVQALAEANTPAALAALQKFADDKDREVRDTAIRALRPKAES